MAASESARRYARFKERQRLAERASGRAGDAQRAADSGSRANGSGLLERVPGDTPKDKKEYLLAERAALELQERLGRVVSRAFAASKLTEVVGVITAAFEKLPVRCAHDLAAEQDPAKVRARLEREVREALSRASLDLTPSEDPEPEGPPEGAPKRRGRKPESAKIGGRLTVRALGKDA